MKILAINSSPKMENGHTAQILGPFLEGMNEAGAEVELVYLKEIGVEPCCGLLRCWMQTPGQCFQVDGMQTLYPKLREADVWVLATPVHLDGMSGPMKNVLDRMVPFLDPRLEMRDGHSRHVVRPAHKWGKVVLVATCGLSEMDNFDPLIVHLRAACKNLGKEFAGAVLRPQSSGMLDTSDGVLDDVFAATREAGRQLVRDGAMSADTLAVVSREIVTNDAFMTNANFFLDMLLEQLGEPPARSSPTFDPTSA
jgi:multimeric flavodoxin WrbA